MIFALVLSIITIALMIVTIIKFPKLNIGKVQLQTFWIIPFISTLIVLIFKLIDFNSVKEGLLSDTSVNPIKILILFFSMTFMSIVLDEFGFFEYLANLALKKAKSSQIKLFITLYVLTSILTVFTSNDIIILTFTPFIIFFTKSAKINPIPYLVSEFVAANTWSMMFIIGNPTNIYLATSFNLSFLEYFLKMIVPTFLGGLSSFTILYLIFRKELKKDLEIEIKEVKITNRFLVITNLVLLIICTIFLVISSYIGLEMYLIALTCASIMLIILIIYSLSIRMTIYLKEALKRLPYSLIPFLISMFIIVLTDESYGITGKITELLARGDSILMYGTTSTLMCNLINNIPMSVLYSSIIPLGNIKALYSTIIGSNIGAFLSPIGALAGIMWLSILKKHDVKYSFIDFVKYGVIVVIPTLIMALVGLYIVL